MKLSGLSYTGGQPTLSSEPFALRFSSAELGHCDLPLVKGS